MNDVTRQFARWIMALAVATVLPVLLSCQQPLEVPGEDWNDHVTDLTAQYQNGLVLLKWNAAGGGFVYYRIYRTLETDSSGQPDTTTLESSGLRARVDASAVSFSDLPAPVSGVYYYGIRTVTEGKQGPVEGPLSWPLASCTVGTEVRLSINRGNVFTVDTVCTLFVDDPLLRLASVRFTQLVADSIRDTATGKMVLYNPGASTAFAGDSFGQVADIVRAGFLSDKKNEVIQGENSRRRITPLFDRADAHNGGSVGGIQAGARQIVVPWVLGPGAGEKTVYAQVTYRQGAGEFALDTLVERIRTSPHKIEIVPRNTAVRDTVQGKPGKVTKEKVSVFYTDEVRFSVKTFGDPTLDRTFSAWVMMKGGVNAVMNPKLLTQETQEHWYMTKPVKYTLADNGDPNATEVQYKFSLNPQDAEGRKILDTVIDGQKLNMLWSSSLTTTPDDVAGTQKAANALFGMTSNSRETEGKKQFLLFLRFSESRFKDSLTLIYGYDDTTKVFSTWFDMYPPTIKFNSDSLRNPDHLRDSAIVYGKFNFALDSVSCWDSGYAQVNAISLVVARKPEGMLWDKKKTAPTLTLDSIFRLPNQTFPFTIDVKGYRQFQVRWDDIDPSNWPSGEYLMGVIVRDEYGREGFAHVSDVDNVKTNSNPWRIIVKTGK